MNGRAHLKGGISLPEADLARADRLERCDQASHREGDLRIGRTPPH
jgi:hypothetical protein